MAKPVPTKLSVKKDEHLQITWPGGETVTYPIAYLRSHCPCALCKQLREAPPVKSRLTILPGNYTQPLAVTAAEMVGNYALRLHWSDNHASGIYSFAYLLEITPPQK